MSTDYDLDGFTVTTFYGGKERGQCLQINVGGQFVVLPWAQAARLSYWLNESSWLRGHADFPPAEAAGNVGVQDQTRERLLARMAGNIAGGIMSGVFATGSGDAIRDLGDSDDIAKAALEVAEAILAQLERKR